jgi:hypothetical protein
MLTVSDTGAGMDARTLARIFEPFFTTKDVGEGTGLGLATVYGIVKASDGYIWVESAPGRGTTFSIYLPRLTAAHVAPHADPTVRPATRSAVTVLLVEDEEAVVHRSRGRDEQPGPRDLRVPPGADPPALDRRGDAAGERPGAGETARATAA